MSCGCFGNPSSQRKKTPVLALREVEGHLLENIRRFSYNELRVATNNFNSSNKIGRGGFGIVYKGIFKSGLQVAVKTLSAESKQGLREFLTEINIISNVRHPNLVELIGCCVEGANRILVYEYVVNNSLDRALLGYTSDRSKLNWEKRSAICLGTARALAFLHEELVPRIVHRDIKASNVLLDKDYLPKVGDFGLAKLFPDDITHISTRIAGTTFGVLILEIVSGQSSSKSNWGGSNKVLLEWAWQLYEEGRLLELVDSEMGEYPEDKAIKYLIVAFFCTQAGANRRPLMSQVIHMLSTKTRLNDKELAAPGFFPDTGGSQKTSAGSSIHFSSTPVTITEMIPR
ncbi:cold-responsive protein kinase 1 isoform X2 [Spinacia oleracea]|uniref:non-specific serine/threonine protein kinase n=1 Tax=Spinacia oleracea TaxID=3562 RepID=A0A9R0IZA5_SPIOL|nr:cold-responsive protein kinase 1-like isoform X2 [Spinacia oleracea]